MLDEVQEWWAKWPDANIGLVTGKVTNLVVIDVDNADGIKTMQEMGNGLKPYTRSPNGYHFWFDFHEGLSNKAALMPGIDVRTDGGYIMAPPGKNTNGGKYSLYPGGDKYEAIPFALYSILKDNSTNALKLDINIANDVPTDSAGKTTNNHNNHKQPQIFIKGTRDDDIFRLANHLIRGGMDVPTTYNYLKFCATNCNPPFPEKELSIKIESAIKRAKTKERNLSAEVREGTLTTTGHFLTTDCHKDLTLTTSDHKKAANMALLRLVKDGILEKFGGKRGSYRLIDQEDDEELCFSTETPDEFRIKLPLQLNDMCKLYAGNIIMIGGSKGAGKTAYMLNIAIMNQHTDDVVYFNSEMGKDEWDGRLSEFGFQKPEDQKFKCYIRHRDFHDKIDGTKKIYIIDFLEIHDNFYEIAKMLRQVHEKLGDGVCVVGVQKKKGAEMAYGGSFSTEKARLYLTLDYMDEMKASRLTIYDAKTPRIRGGVRGMYRDIKIIGGSRLSPLTEWVG